jgi:hypothetical protein
MATVYTITPICDFIRERLKQLDERAETAKLEAIERDQLARMLQAAAQPKSDPPKGNPPT